MPECGSCTRRKVNARTPPGCRACLARMKPKEKETQSVREARRLSWGGWKGRLLK